MELKQITGSTFCLTCPDVTVPFYRLASGKLVLLDSGVDTGSRRDELLAALEPYTIEAIITSHGHTDHVGAHRHLQELGARVIVPRLEACYLESAEKLKAWYQLFSPGEIQRLFPGVLFNADELILPEQKEVTAGGEVFGLIHTPGHSMEHTSIMTPDGVLYVADALLTAKECSFAKLPYAFCISTFMASAESLRGIKARAYVLAHGGITDNIDGLIDSNIRCFNHRADRVLSCIASPMTLEDIIAAVIDALHLKPSPSPYTFRVYERNIRSFIDYLVDTGRLYPEAQNGRMYYHRS